MLIPPFDTPDYLREAQGRVTEQFRESDIFKRYLETLVDGYDDILKCLEDLVSLRSLSTAEGVQLDMIGEIVGQPRVLVEVDLYQYFGFQGALNAESLGDLNSPLGGVFYNLGDILGGNRSLTDEQYRMFIRAKIFKNSFTATPEEFITAVNQIFQTESTFISLDEGGHAVVYFGRELSSFERVLINYVFTGGDYPVRLIPKTVGVGLDFGVYREGDYFGFAGTPGAKGFGGLSTIIGGYGADYGLSYGAETTIPESVCEDTTPEDYGLINQALTGVDDFGLTSDPATVFLDYETETENCVLIDGGWFSELIPRGGVAP